MAVVRQRVAVNRLVNVLAAIGIFYQIFSQTLGYFSYNYYSLVTRSDVNTRLPAITVCASFWQGSYEDYITSLPVHQASLLMPSYDQVINYCHLTLPNGTVVNCSSITKPHKYMNNKMLCFTLFEQSRTSLPDDQLMYSQEGRLKNSISTPLFRVKFNTPWNDSNHYSITIRSPTRPIRLLRSTESKVWVEPRVNEEVILNYRITRRTELAPPHGSCRRYPEPNDSEQTMLNCWFDKFVNASGVHYWPHWIFYDFEKNYTQEEKSRHWPSQAVNDREFPAVNEKCSKLSSNIDCDRSYINLYKIATFQSDHPGQYIIVGIPWLPAIQLNIKNYPKKSFFQFLNEIGGILSMWIGFSVYASGIHLTTCAFRSLLASSTRSTPSRTMRFANRRRRSTIKDASSDYFARFHQYSRLRGLNNLAVRLICWATTLYFVVEIIMIYFEIPFDTSIIVRTPNRLDLLKVSICLDMNIHPRKVKKFYPHLYESVPKDKWKDTFTIDQLFRTTTDWDEIYDPSSFYLSPDNIYTKIHQDFNFTKSITGRLTCFTTFGQREYQHEGTIKKHFRTAIAFGTNVVLSLNTSKLLKLNQSRITVTFHQDDLLKEDLASPDLFTIIANKDARLYPDNFIVRITRTSRKLYPNHIRSTCWEYEKKFGYDRSILLDRCIFENFISKYRVWPSGYQVWRNSTRDLQFVIKGINIGELNISNYSMQEEFKSIQEKCNKILYRSECDTTFVRTRVEDEFYNDPGLTTIILFPPVKQFLVYEQQATYTVIDLIGYIGGTINAWIGLSFLDVDCLFLIFLNLIRCQCFQSNIDEFDDKMTTSLYRTHSRLLPIHERDNFT